MAVTYVEMYTDGACSTNTGKGGWACVLLDFYGKRKEITGAESKTTNNRMELTAVIMGLKAIKQPCNVKVYSDSKYVIEGAGRARSWRKKGWYISSGQPVKNRDLWEKLLGLTDIYNVTFQWVKGHNGVPENERCDQLATRAAATL